MNKKRNQKPLNWLIERAHQIKASAAFNAPVVIEWRSVGNVKATTKRKAMNRAVEITGAPSSELRVVGITFTSPNETHH